MTLKELYEWAVEHSADNLDVEIINDESEKRGHGEWEYHSNPDCGVDPEDAFCSMCGFYIDRTLVDNFDNYNFCPRCGADMRGETE